MSENPPTLRNCVRDVLETADEETLKEMLAISILGKDYLEIQGSGLTLSVNALIQIHKIHKIYKRFVVLGPIGWIVYVIDEKRKLESKVELIEAIIENMESAIIEGSGIVDKVFRNMNLYPKQLQHCIEILTTALEKKAEELKDEEWKNNLRDIRNKYSNINLTCETAIELEEVIVTLLIDAYLKTLPAEEREKISKAIAMELEKYAIEYIKNADLSQDLSQSQISAGRISFILTYGGLIALRKMLGFNFHILLAIVINAIWRHTGAVIIGSGLSLPVNALIQKLSARILRPTGPIGCVIFAIILITLLPLIFKLLNPREYDKYIPLVVYIYILRKNIKRYLKYLPE